MNKELKEKLEKQVTEWSDSLLDFDAESDEAAKIVENIETLTKLIEKDDDLQEQKTKNFQETIEWEDKQTQVLRDNDFREKELKCKLLTEGASVGKEIFKTTTLVVTYLTVLKIICKFEARGESISGVIGRGITSKAADFIMKM